jgi:hypothetical protein
MTKVETDSKYPLKVTGLLLFNGFVNTRQVDVSASPAYALPGPGSTGLSLRQTVLGLDARGPHLFNATSHADLRVDFFANNTLSNYAAAGFCVCAPRMPHWIGQTPRHSSSWIAPSLSRTNRLLWLPSHNRSWRGQATYGAGTRRSACRINLPFQTHRGSRHRQLNRYLRSGAAGVHFERASRHRNGAQPLAGNRGAHCVSAWRERHWAEIGVGGYFSPHRTR